MFVLKVFSNDNTLIVTQQQKLVFEDILGESDTTVVNCQCQRPKGLKSWVNNSRVTQYRVFYFILNHPHRNWELGRWKYWQQTKFLSVFVRERAPTNMEWLKSIHSCDWFSWPCKLFVKGLSRDMKKKAVKMPQGCLLVQAGQNFEHITGGYVLAGYHEVIYTEATKEAFNKRAEEFKSQGVERN